MTESTQERRLTEALCRGDDLALSDAFDRYGDLIFTVVRRIVVDRVIAEDVTQEVLLYLWRNADRIDLTRGSVRALIVTIARRRAIDHVRSEENRRRRELTVATSGKVDLTVPDIADDVTTSDFRFRSSAAMLTAIESLPETERVAIDLVYYRGHTLRSMAKATNSPEGTAKARVRRALRRLEQILDTQTAEAC